MGLKIAARRLNSSFHFDWRAHSDASRRKVQSIRAKTSHNSNRTLLVDTVPSIHPIISSVRPFVPFRSCSSCAVPCRVFWPLGLGSQSVSQLVSHRASSVAQSGNTIGPQGNHSPFISINGEVRCGGWRFTTDDDCSREWRFVICRTSIAAKSRLGRGLFLRWIVCFAWKLIISTPEGPTAS